MDAPQQYETILVERIGLIERITLNRPEKRNALSPLLQDELIDAVHGAERGNDVRVIVIRGAGPSFCSGYDIKLSKEDAARVRPQTLEQDVALTISYGNRWANLWNCRIPVIAQVHGHCIAGGTDIALHCDLVVAADDARIGFPPVRSQGAPPTHMWLYHAGPQWTKRLLLTGDTITGAQAAAIGLVSHALPAADVLPAALAMARDIAVNCAPLSVALSKRLLWESRVLDRDEIGRRETVYHHLVMGRPDALEGVTSFLERRPPDWRLAVPRDWPPRVE